MRLIVAAAANGVIGKDNKLPWHLPDDLQYFKETTMGSPMIMGRKTFESLGRPLPGRAHLIITRNPDYSPKQAINSIRRSQEQKEIPEEKFADCHVFHSLEEAKKFLGDNAENAFLIGGAQLFKTALPSCSKLYLTKIHQEFEGDVFLPEIDLNSFKLINEERKDAPFAHSYCVYERI